MYLKIISTSSFETRLSITITKDGLFDDALTNPHEPLDKLNLIPFTVFVSTISQSATFVLFFWS